MRYNSHVESDNNGNRYNGYNGDVGSGNNGTNGNDSDYDNIYNGYNENNGYNEYNINNGNNGYNENNTPQFGDYPIVDFYRGEMIDKDNHPRVKQLQNIIKTKEIWASLLGEKNSNRTPSLHPSNNIDYLKKKLDNLKQPETMVKFNPVFYKQYLEKQVAAGNDIFDYDNYSCTNLTSDYWKDVSLRTNTKIFLLIGGRKYFRASKQGNLQRHGTLSLIKDIEKWSKTRNYKTCIIIDTCDYHTRIELINKNYGTDKLFFITFSYVPLQFYNDIVCVVNWKYETIESIKANTVSENENLCNINRFLVNLLNIIFTKFEINDIIKFLKKNKQTIITSINKFISIFKTEAEKLEQDIKKKKNWKEMYNKDKEYLNINEFSNNFNQLNKIIDILNNLPIYSPNRKFFDRNQNIIQTIFNMELEIINNNHDKYFSNLNESLVKNKRRSNKITGSKNTNYKKVTAYIERERIKEVWKTKKRGRNIYPVKEHFCGESVNRQSRTVQTLSLFNDYVQKKGFPYPNPLCVVDTDQSLSCNKYPDYPDKAYKFYLKELFTKFETNKELFHFLTSTKIVERTNEYEDLSYFIHRGGRRKRRKTTIRRGSSAAARESIERRRIKESKMRDLKGREAIIYNHELIFQYYKKYVNLQLKFKILMFFYLYKLLFQTDTPKNKTDLRQYMSSGIFKLIVGKYITKSDIIHKINKLGAYALKTDRDKHNDYSFLLNFEEIYNNINKILKDSTTIEIFFGNLKQIEIYPKNTERKSATSSNTNERRLNNQNLRNIYKN
jgi:hypothetical protein